MGHWGRAAWLCGSEGADVGRNRDVRDVTLSVAVPTGTCHIVPLHGGWWEEWVLSRRVWLPNCVFA